MCITTAPAEWHNDFAFAPWMNHLCRCSSTDINVVWSFPIWQEKMKGKNKLVPRLLGITKESVMRVDEKTKDVVQEWPLTTVKRWAASPKSFTLVLWLSASSPRHYLESQMLYTPNPGHIFSYSVHSVIYTALYHIFNLPPQFSFPSTNSILKMVETSDSNIECFEQASQLFHLS